MLTVEGTYKDGKIELLETPKAIDPSRVLVIFLDAKTIDLKSIGIDESQAADLRGRLQSFAEDWDRPEASVYDQD